MFGFQLVSEIKTNHPDNFRADQIRGEKLRGKKLRGKIGCMPMPPPSYHEGGGGRVWPMPVWTS